MSAALVLPMVWATAAPLPDVVDWRELPEVGQHKPVVRGMAFYRRYTEAILRRYVCMSMEAGRAPSLLGREMFRGKVTSYRVHSFEDVVIFVHDVEKCLAKLDIEQREIVERVASMGYCRVTQAGSAWVVSTLPSGATETRLIGVSGEGVDCKLSSTGLVTFFAGRVPVPGEFVTMTYRGDSRAIARLEDGAGIAAEAAGGMPGTARWLGKVLQPQARSSVDCEFAAQAILSFAASRAAAIAGSYETTNPADVWPGDVLAMTANSSTTSVVVRRVTVADGMASPEVLNYRIEFANDWAEGLGLKLSEAIASDALLPQTALNAPGNVLANLQQLQVVSSTGTALQLDAGLAPPAGGGFEVRRRDWDFGPGVDQDLVLRSPVRSFSIPREGQVEQYYVRMFDASMPPLYSRFSSAVFTDIPVS